MNDALLNKISQNQEIFGIIGLGYVGLPLATLFAEAGIHVVEFDKSKAKVDKVSREKVILKTSMMLY